MKLGLLKQNAVEIIQSYVNKNMAAGTMSIDVNVKWDTTVKKTVPLIIDMVERTAVKEDGKQVYPNVCTPIYFPGYNLLTVSIEGTELLSVLPEGEADVDCLNEIIDTMFSVIPQQEEKKEAEVSTEATVENVADVVDSDSMSQDEPTVVENTDVKYNGIEEDSGVEELGDDIKAVSISNEINTEPEEELQREDEVVNDSAEGIIETSDAIEPEVKLTNYTDMKLNASTNTSVQVSKLSDDDKAELLLKTGHAVVIEEEPEEKTVIEKEVKESTEVPLTSMEENIKNKFQKKLSDILGNEDYTDEQLDTLMKEFADTKERTIRCGMPMRVEFDVAPYYRSKVNEDSCANEQSYEIKGSADDIEEIDPVVQDEVLDVDYAENDKSVDINANSTTDNKDMVLDVDGTQESDMEVSLPCDNVMEDDMEEVPIDDMEEVPLPEPVSTIEESAPVAEKECVSSAGDGLDSIDTGELEEDSLYEEVEEEEHLDEEETLYEDFAEDSDGVIEEEYNVDGNLLQEDSPEQSLSEDVHPCDSSQEHVSVAATMLNGIDAVLFDYDSKNQKDVSVGQGDSLNLGGGEPQYDGSELSEIDEVYSLESVKEIEDEVNDGEIDMEAEDIDDYEDGSFEAELEVTSDNFEDSCDQSEGGYYEDGYEVAEDDSYNEEMLDEVSQSAEYGMDEEIPEDDGNYEGEEEIPDWEEQKDAEGNCEEIISSNSDRFLNMFNDLVRRLERDVQDSTIYLDVSNSNNVISDAVSMFYSMIDNKVSTLEVVLYIDDAKVTSARYAIGEQGTIGYRDTRPEAAFMNEVPRFISDINVTYHIGVRNNMYKEDEFLSVLSRRCDSIQDCSSLKDDCWILIDSMCEFLSEVYWLTRKGYGKLCQR